jgi:hypothetical protein
MYFLNVLGIERIIMNGGPFKFKLQIDDYEATKIKIIVIKRAPIK